MKKINLIASFFLLIGVFGCQDQLDIANPNLPTPESAQNEQGIISLAQGALYLNGFQGTKFGSYFFGIIVNYHERMGDIVGSQFVPLQLYCPDRIILDNGKILESINAQGQKKWLRDINIPSSQSNPLAYEWTFMYSLNGAMNSVLANVDEIDLSDDKKNTIKAWSYFWKGFAYSRIGSMYYAGIINDEFNKLNNEYVSKNEIVSEAESNFSKAETLLMSLSGNADYQSVIDALIPSVCKIGKGGPPTTEEWIRNINTMRARNILVNTPAADMRATLWDQVLTLSLNGIIQSDNTFTIRTDDLGNLLPTTAYTAAQAIGPAANGGGGNVVSERLIQDFKPGDKRFVNNFNQIQTWIGPGFAGTSFNTRYLLVNKGKGMPGVVTLVNRDIGAHELYIAGSYEENVLMLAEANIYKGNVDAGLDKIDELRIYQGAGLAATAGTGLSADQAKEELRRERRVALAFRGFSFYDARRWGVLENGRTGCVVVDFAGVVSTNATIQYGYLDYWDVPIAESFYNPPSPDSAPIRNPN